MAKRRACACSRESTSAALPYDDRGGQRVTWIESTDRNDGLAVLGGTLGLASCKKRVAQRMACHVWTHRNPAWSFPAWAV